MNNKKRNIELISAVMSIVVGCLTFIGSIVQIAAIKNYYNDVYYYTFNAATKSIIIFTFVILALVGIAAIVIGLLVCPNPYKNGTVKNRKGLIVTLLVLISVLTCIYTIFTSMPLINIMSAAYVSYTSVVYVSLQSCIAIIALIVASLVMKNTSRQDNIQHNNAEGNNL